MNKRNGFGDPLIRYPLMVPHKTAIFQNHDKRYESRQNLLVWEAGNRRKFKQLLFLSITPNIASIVTFVKSQFNYFGPKNTESQPLYVSMDIAVLHVHCKSFSGFASSNSASGLKPQTKDGRCHFG